MVGFDWRAEYKNHVGHGIESEAPGEPMNVVRRYACVTVVGQEKCSNVSSKFDDLTNLSLRRNAGGALPQSRQVLIYLLSCVDLVVRHVHSDKPLAHNYNISTLCKLHHCSRQSVVVSVVQACDSTLCNQACNTLYTANTGVKPLLSREKTCIHLVLGLERRC